MSDTATAFTVGIEEEYQLVDPETGAMHSSATSVREQDWTGELAAELQETTIEIGTPVCSSAEQVERELRRLRLQASTVAAAQGLAIVAAGLHPFSGWVGHTRPALERYRAIEARYGRIARDEHIFGMHVHVAVPAGVDRIPLINVLRHYLPHLLALSASSPFFEGEDTGFASFRTILWRRWPGSGIPPRFDDEPAFRDYIAQLLDAGMLADPWNVYWSLRPHPKYPTVEFRVMDVCPNVTTAVAVAALARALVHASCRGRLGGGEPAFDPAIEQELLRMNEWSVGRDGLDAVWMDTVRGTGSAPIRSAIRRLLDDVAPAARELGDAQALSHIETILEQGSAADRMRRVHGERGGMKELVAWLVEESMLGSGMDRRAAQRDG